jgi:hypothetical protein
MMKKAREIRCYDYVNRPYAEVKELLTKKALAVFQSATKAAAQRAQSVASELRADVAGLSVSANIKISLHQIEDNSSDRMAIPTTRLQLEWEAVAAPSMFPFMKADLYLYSFTATETQLDFHGFYEPPFGFFGKAVDGLVGHRIAEASVHRFIAEVAEYLRQTLTGGDRGAVQANGLVLD